jgi:transcription antitermination factor NusG
MMSTHLTDQSNSPSEMVSLHAENTEHRWFALGVTARHEKTVSQMLRYKGYETLLPVYTRRHEYTRRIREFELPLFPGYVFCRFNPLVRLPILTTPGVIQVIGAGRIPIAVEDQEIASLQTAMAARIQMAPFRFWQEGQKGRIRDGPLAGLEGMVVRAKQTVRLVLSVTLLKRSVLLEVDTDRVSLI